METTTETKEVPLCIAVLTLKSTITYMEILNDPLLEYSIGVLKDSLGGLETLQQRLREASINAPTTGEHKRIQDILYPL